MSPRPLAGRARSQCVRRVVGGQTVCLKAGRRCRSAFQHDYLKAGLDCRRGRLRRAGLAARREGEPVLIDRHGRIDPRNALEAFDTAVAPLPGITSRTGAVGRIDDATSIVAAVAAQAGRLTLGQRAVLERALTPSPPATQAAVDPAEVATFVGLAAEARTRIMSHGYGFAHNLIVAFPESNQEPVSGKAARGYAWPGWLDRRFGGGANCIVFLTPAGRAQGLAGRRRTVAHEVFHCAQFEHFSSLEAWARVPQWVIEGGANWAGDQIALEWNGGDAPDGLWLNWFARPELDLGVRDYDAIGFFATLAQGGVDVFGRMHDVLRAAAAGGDGPAYAAAVGGAPPAFYDTWGPSYVRSLAFGPTWDLTGPGILRSFPLHAVIGDGAVFTRGVEPRAGMAAQLSLEADVIAVAARVRHGLLHTLGGQGPLRDELLCTKPGGCSCPDGPIDARQVPKGIAAIGWQGGSVALAGRSLAAECDREGKAGGGAGRHLEVHQSDPQGHDHVLVSFTRAVCSLGTYKGRRDFWARSTQGPYDLQVHIWPYTGRHDYTLAYGSPHGLIDFALFGPGAHGQYTNLYPPPGLHATGAIRFDAAGNFSLGFAAAFNNNFTKSVALGGALTCRYPRR